MQKLTGQKHVPRIAFNVFNSKLELPTKDEGFASVRAVFWLAGSIRFICVPSLRCRSKGTSIPVVSLPRAQVVTVKFAPEFESEKARELFHEMA